MIYFLISINPLDVFLWTFRRNEKDIVKLYNTLSPVMGLATDNSMLNFGYWFESCADPDSAQKNLCRFFGNFAELSAAHHVVDVGSGLAAPSKLWGNIFQNLNLYCININLQQLLCSGSQRRIEFFNSTSTKLPFLDNSVDRVLALESAQHFKPLDDFISEAKRILLKNGLLVMALPVTNNKYSLKKAGLLNFTWSSEHYSLEHLRHLLETCGFEICDQKLIGSNVYEPLCNYYIQNRILLKQKILKKYPKYVENILYYSLKKMKTASEEKIIDYVIIKCR